MEATALYLVKVGEILLKLGNRREFENRLKADIGKRLSGIPHKIEYQPGRYFVSVDEESAAAAEEILSRTPGVNGWARCLRRSKNFAEIEKAALEVAATAMAKGGRSFKVESRRSDKSFPLDSFAISKELGHSILVANPESRVDLHKPDFLVNVEIRDRAFVYGNPSRGVKGLPVGSQGRGLLLLSGGIDSPVAGYLMAKRGLNLEAMYFHAWPYTSKEAHDKVKDLARVLSAYTGGITLWTVPFTDIQMALKKGAREDLTTLMMRAAMMEIAHSFATKRGDTCIVTGESLGQVASQTAQNLRFTQFPTDLPVLRPLIGIDKEDTIAIAKEIGSFDISVRPFEDCCVIFSPEHPLLRAVLGREKAAYEALGLGPLIAAAIEGIEKLELPFSERIVPGR
ncbi:MAG TPA: tRNA uracil 4-sulfurtransferase ThiI [Rectinemataceae bacterium]|nr:tRNA uracil 4-sulfurtransferase ThiI [Rectinemataceae bacterium]